MAALPRAFRRQLRKQDGDSEQDRYHTRDQRRQRAGSVEADEETAKHHVR
jgi:hypothetical protein